MKNYISMKTAWLRYGFINVLMKYITPSLYEKLIYKIIVSSVPRRSTSYMKEYFGDTPLVGAEIGVDRGLNSLNLLKMLNMKMLYLVDVYSSSPSSAFGEAFVRLKSFRRSTEFKIGLSVDMAKVLKGKGVELDFVYIDANHDYDFVYEDLNAWIPLVKDGGIVAGHDVFNCEGVINAVKDWCIENGVKFIIDTPDWYFVKDW